MKENKYTAIIPARGGSKGLPKKNVLDLCGKPLIAHTIVAALESKRFTRVIVSTDCKEIKKTSLEWGADVLDRPAIYATDTASSLDVITHVLEYFPPVDDYSCHFVLLQPTSPLRTQINIAEAIQQFESENAQTLVSATECDDTPFKYLYRDGKGKIKPIRRWSDLTNSRQMLPLAYKVNGAIYISNSSSFLNSKTLINSTTSMYVMKKSSSVDIDDEHDLEITRRLMLNE